MSHRMGHTPTTELADLRTLAASLKGEYDAACASAARLNAEWLVVTDRASKLWNARQRTLAAIHQQEALAGASATGAATAAHRMTRVTRG